MKKLLFILSFVIAFQIQSRGQILKPVTWSYAAKRTGSNTATLYLMARIDEGWHLYSQFIKEGGPVKTTFRFARGKGYSLVGNTFEPKPITKYESTFQMNLSYFEKSVVFQQKIKISGKNALVNGKVEFMVCDDRQCLPPDEIEFSIPVK